MTKPAILALDGGGTSCRATLCDVDGVELGSAVGPFANLVTDFAASRQHVSDVIDDAYAAAGRSTDDRHRDVAVLGVAGAEIDDAGARLAETLSFAGIRVLSDRDIAVAGILGEGDGTLAQIGTGSFFVRRRDGVARHIGGWGLTLGDEASGAWLGRELLRSVLLAHDGLMTVTPLTRSVMDHFGGHPDSIVLFAGNALPGDFAALAPMLFDGFAADDQVARHVVGLGLVALETILTSLDGDDGGDLYLTGGIGDRYRPLLSEGLRIRLAEPRGDALSGANAIGRRMLPL